MIIFLKKLKRLKNICAYAWIFVFVCVFAYQYSAHRGQKLELEVVVVSVGTECGSCWAISSISFPSLIFFEIGSYDITHTGLELTVLPKLTLN